MTRVPITTALLLLGLCVRAGAQPAPHKPTPQDLDNARKHFQRAEAAKAKGEYQTAALEYLAAYELFEEPAFFFDTAEVYRLAGDEKAALGYYTKYLELAPKGEGAAAARTALDAIQHSIAAKEDAAAAAAKHEPKPDVKAPPVPVPVVVVKPPVETSKVPPAEESVDRGRGLRIAGIAVAGAAAVSLGFGIGFGIKAHGLANEASGWTTFDAARDARGRADQRDMYVLLGIGGAALVASQGLLYFAHRANRRGVESVAVAPLGEQGFAVTASGHF